jgi:hypothetical protein
MKQFHTERFGTLSINGGEEFRNSWGDNYGKDFVSDWYAFKILRVAGAEGYGGYWCAFEDGTNFILTYPTSLPSLPLPTDRDSRHFCFIAFLITDDHDRIKIHENKPVFCARKGEEFYRFA